MGKSHSLNSKHIRLNTQQQLWIKQLFPYLSFPSISTDVNFQKDLSKTAKYLEGLLKDAGCTTTQIISGYGNDIVFGECVVHTKYPTFLVYGHYDVQPPGDIGKWGNPPFRPMIKPTDVHPTGAIFARGASDQKCQLFIYIKALETLLHSGCLGCNIKFLIEGEEEIGSPHLHKFVKDHRELLVADAIFISDTAFVAKDTPTITTSLRGFTGLKVTLETTRNEMHSGSFGGALRNPILELCRLINGLSNDAGEVLLKEFYDEVIRYDRTSDKGVNTFVLPIKEEDAKFLMDETGFSPIELATVRPSLDVHGIKGGYIEEGIKTIVPREASAVLSLRLVANQKAQVIQNRLVDYFIGQKKNNVNIKLKRLPNAEPYFVDSKNPYLQKAKMALLEVYRSDVFELNSGGSLPILSTFEKELNCKSILLGFGLGSDNVHGVDEHFGLENLFKGVDTIVTLFSAKS